MDSLFQIQFAIRTVLKVKAYLLIFIISTIALFISLIVLPLFTVPGNTLSLQLEIFTTRDYLLMIFLSLLAGLNISLSGYNFIQQKKISDASQSAAGGAVSTIAGIFGAIVATASCLGCLMALLGIVGLGLGSALFILKNQSYFLLGAIGLMLVSLYFAAQKVTRVCDSC